MVCDGSSQRLAIAVRSFPVHFQTSYQVHQLAKIKKLRDRGLTDDEIAELLEIPLESIIGINLEESA